MPWKVDREKGEEWGITADRSTRWAGVTKCWGEGVKEGLLANAKNAIALNRV